MGSAQCCPFSWHVGPGHDSPDWTFDGDMSKASEVEIRFRSEGPGKPSSNSTTESSSVTAKAPNNFALSSTVPVPGLEFWIALPRALKRSTPYAAGFGSIREPGRNSLYLKSEHTMKPVVFLRIASILTLIHSIMHTIGGTFGKPPSAQAAMIAASMRYRFEVFGVMRSYADFTAAWASVSPIALTMDVPQSSGCLLHWQDPIPHVSVPSSPSSSWAISHLRSTPSRSSSPARSSPNFSSLPVSRVPSSPLNQRMAMQSNPPRQN